MKLPLFTLVAITVLAAPVIAGNGLNRRDTSIRGGNAHAQQQTAHSPPVTSDSQIISHMDAIEKRNRYHVQYRDVTSERGPKSRIRLWAARTLRRIRSVHDELVEAVQRTRLGANRLVVPVGRGPTGAYQLAITLHDMHNFQHKYTDNFQRLLSEHRDITVHQRIGAGGFGTVHLATQHSPRKTLLRDESMRDSLGQVVAIKFPDMRRFDAVQ